MNIIEAMEDPELFGKSFPKKRGLFGKTDSWAAWKIFLRALFNLEMSAEQLAVFEKHSGGRRDVCAFQEAYCIAGRRGGKSRIEAAIAVFLACFRDYSAYLAAGETGTIAVIAPDRRQAAVILGYVKALLKDSRLIAQMVRAELSEAVEIEGIGGTRIRIEVMTADYRTIRGRTLLACVVDEIAFLPVDDGSANPAEEILNAALPSMATIPNSFLIGVSSPYARKGVLYDRYSRFYGIPGSSVLVWKASTREMNPLVDPKVITAAYTRDAASARAEYGAEFRDDIADYLTRAVIEQRVIRDRIELGFNAKNSYFGFVDPSGGSSDSMTLAIAHLEKGVAVLDCIRETRPPFSPEAVVQEFSDRLKYFRVREVEGDRYAGEWPREQFQKRGITYRVADKSRSELYLELLPAVTSGQVELLDHPGLIAQLSSLERKTTRFGKDAIDHPSGAHDDVANSAAGVLVLALASESSGYGLLDAVAQMRAKFGESIGSIENWFAPKPKEPGHVVVASSRTETRDENKPPADTSKCPVCQSTCVVRAPVVTGSWGYLCNQCGATFDRSAQVLTKLEASGQCCGSPLLVKIGDSVKCNNCGRQTQVEQIAHGVSREQHSRGLSSFRGLAPARQRPRVDMPPAGLSGRWRN